jgi:hypothetical protein
MAPKNILNECFFYDFSKQNHKKSTHSLFYSSGWSGETLFTRPLCLSIYGLTLAALRAAFLEAHQFHVECQVGICGDNGGGTSGPIAQLSRDKERCFGTWVQQ